MGLMRSRSSAIVERMNGEGLKSYRLCVFCATCPTRGYRRKAGCRAGGQGRLSKGRDRSYSTRATSGINHSGLQ